MKYLIIYITIVVTTTSFCFDLRAEELPNAESLFEKHVEASYGKNGLKENPSMTTKINTLITQYNITNTNIVKTKSPGFRYTEGEIMGTSISSGCSLSFCWEQGMRGLEIVEGSELQRWLEHGDYHRWENMDKYSKSMETQQLTQWEGEEAYKVKVVNAFGKEDFYYFSKEHGFMIGNELKIADLGGFNLRTTTYSDFKQFGPFYLPVISDSSNASGSFVQTIQSISFEDIPNSVFDIPQDVKQLISKQ